MDRGKKLMHTIIESAIDKGVRDIKENPSRGIRNLVDLGIHFATGHFQKNFFYIAQQILGNKNTPYYELVNHIAEYVHPQILKRFGVNLGYNSWTYGAEKIRKYEKEQGYIIPWTFVFNFIKESKNRISETDVSNVLDTGETMGIYCGMFFAGKDKNHLKKLISMLKSHEDSSYFIFLKPELITDEISSMIVNSGNIVIVLNMNAQEDNVSCKNAAQILLKNKCLYGVYSTYNDDNVGYVISDEYLGLIQDLCCSFAFFVRQNLNKAANIERFSKFMHTAKSSSKYRFFLTDFYDDIAYIDKVISVKDCLITINSDGNIAISNTDNLNYGLNIKTHSLTDIFKKTMPKTQYT